MIGQSPGSVTFGFSQRELSIFTLLSHPSRRILARSVHERPSPDHPRSAVSGHASYSSRASGTIPFSDSCMGFAPRFAYAYRVAYPAWQAGTYAGLLGSRMSLPYRAVSKHLGSMGE